MPQPQPKPKLMSRQEFLDQIRSQVPELKDFSDITLMNEILKRRPDLRDKVENPLAGDTAAAREQSRALARSHSLVDPQYWKDNPNMARFVKGVLDAFPAGGAMVGGSPGALSYMAAPWSGGTSVPVSTAMMMGGGALGAGAGRGLRDLSAQVLGLEQSTPLQKATNIGVDTAIAGMTPGIIEAAKSPIQTARWAVGDYSKILPRRLAGWVEPQFLENFARGPKPFRPGPVMPDFAPEIPPTSAPTPPTEPIQGEFQFPEHLKTPPTPKGSPQGDLFSGGETPAGNAPPTDAGPSVSSSGPTSTSTGWTTQSGKTGPSTTTDVAKHIVLSKNNVVNMSQHLKPGTRILIKAKDATPDTVREAIDSGFTFNGLNDEGHFRFTKVGE